MIDFYKAWKEDKEAEIKPKKQKKGISCKICGKSVNGLKSHVTDIHGKDMWQRYLAAEQKQIELARQAFIELL